MAPEPAEDEVVELCRDLIRIDTVNYGDGPARGSGRPPSTSPRSSPRSGSSATLSSRRRAGPAWSPASRAPTASRDALLVHGHLDVVPAQAERLAGRPVLRRDRRRLRLGPRRRRHEGHGRDDPGGRPRPDARPGGDPPRDIVLAFLADEEAGGVFGAHWLVDNHPDLFEGCTEAIGEVGGFSLTVVDDLRLYLIETAEKGIAWMRLTATGRAGHGSMINDDNAVTELCRGGRAARPARVPGPRHQDRAGVPRRASADALGIELDPDDMEATRRHSSAPSATIIGATLRNTVQPDDARRRLQAQRHPRRGARPTSTAASCPGCEEEFFEHDRRAARPGHHPRVRPPRHRARDRLRRRARRRDDARRCRPRTRARGRCPYMLSGGTDAKAFSGSGIRCFGFAPLRLPPDLDFAGMFHGVDERVPGRRAAVRRPRARPVPRPRLSLRSQPAGAASQASPGRCRMILRREPDADGCRRGRAAAARAPRTVLGALGQRPAGLLARRPAREPQLEELELRTGPSHPPSMSGVPGRGGSAVAARVVGVAGGRRRHLVERREDLVGQRRGPRRAGPAQLRGRPGSHDRRGHAGTVAHPGERDLERREPETVRGRGHGVDDPLRVSRRGRARRTTRSAARPPGCRPGCRRGTSRSGPRGPAGTRAAGRGRAPGTRGRPRARHRAAAASTRPGCSRSARGRARPAARSRRARSASRSSWRRPT